MLNLDAPSSVYTDFDSLAKLKLNAREPTPEVIKQVANQFEALFLSMMLKSMRQAKLADGIMDSQQSDFYRDMYDQQLAVQLAGNPGFGLAEFILKQIGPKNARNDKKLDAEYYLSHAGAVSASALPVFPETQAPASAANAMDASGLNALERGLAGVQASRPANGMKWQAQDDEWQSYQLVNSEANNSRQNFIDQLLPHARQAAIALGVDANLLLAQAALETGWGQAVVKNGMGESSYNLFNIKADKSWQGKQAKALTVEFDGGVARKEMAGFRSYNSYRECFADYVNFIKTNPRYGEALKKAANPKQYIYELQQAGYATDPKYAEKILNIYNSRNADAARTEKSAG
ncbi:MAG: flagellar assembly peptidoglycan hydrolase FlgJ [Methylomonas sp.]|jgi:flagellar protein FlgJ